MHQTVFSHFQRGMLPPGPARVLLVWEEEDGCASSFKPLTPLPLGIRVFFQDFLKAPVLVTEEATSPLRDLSRLSGQSDTRDPSVVEMCACSVSHVRSELLTFRENAPGQRSDGKIVTKSGSPDPEGADVCDGNVHLLVNVRYLHIVPKGDIC